MKEKDLIGSMMTAPSDRSNTEDSSIVEDLRNHRSFIEDWILVQQRRLVELHVRTVAAIMMWLVVVLLILNRFLLNSAWILLISVALVITAVIVYFTPRLRK